ncbi:hypothetical protein GCM10009625_33670 [Brachybacterium fresconis]
MLGERTADVQVHLDGRVPGGAVDLGPVGDVEHPQPLARADERQRSLRLRGPVAARGPTASAGTGSARGGHLARLPLFHL